MSIVTYAFREKSGKVLPAHTSICFGSMLGHLPENGKSIIYYTTPRCSEAAYRVWCKYLFDEIFPLCNGAVISSLADMRKRRVIEISVSAPAVYVMFCLYLSRYPDYSYKHVELFRIAKRRKSINTRLAFAYTLQGRDTAFHDEAGIPAEEAYACSQLQSLQGTLKRKIKSSTPYRGHTVLDTPTFDIRFAYIFDNWEEPTNTTLLKQCASYTGYPRVDTHLFMLLNKIPVVQKERSSLNAVMDKYYPRDASSWERDSFDWTERVSEDGSWQHSGKQVLDIMRELTKGMRNE